MHNPRSLTLIAPELTRPLMEAAQGGEDRWPELARLAGHGVIEAFDASRNALSDVLPPWRRALLNALGLPQSVEDYPEAAVIRTGDTGEIAEGYWLCATPMHFAAGLSRLSAIALDADASVTAEERGVLEILLAAHLRDADMLLTTSSSGEWLVRAQRELDLATASPESATRNALEEMMPRGADGARLRRLMTELQMMLHEHPVNLARTRRGLPEINAIWFYGAGALKTIGARELPEGFGEDAYLRGLFLMNRQQVSGPAMDAEPVVAQMHSDAVAVLSTRTLDELESRWIAPLLRALRAGVIARLSLVIAGYRLTIDRSALFRFWRGARSPARWAL